MVSVDIRIRLHYKSSNSIGSVRRNGCFGTLAIGSKDGDQRMNGPYEYAKKMRSMIEIQDRWALECLSANNDC